MMSKAAQILELSESSWAWDATLEERMANLLHGPGTLHDFTFRLGPNPDQDWISVHKIIVASGSPVFYRIIKDAGAANYVNAFQLPSSVGTQEFIRLIEFLYNGRLDFQKVTNLIELKNLYEAAQKYEMRNLQHLCKGGIDMLQCLEKNNSPSTSDQAYHANFDNVASTSSGICKPFLPMGDMMTQINSLNATTSVNTDTKMLPIIQEEVAKLKINLKTELVDRLKDEFLYLANDMTREFAILSGELKAEVSQEIRDFENGLIRSPQLVEEPQASVSASNIYGPIGSQPYGQPRPDTSDTYSWTSSEDIGAGRPIQSQRPGSRGQGYQNPQNQRPSRATSTPYPGTLTDQQNHQPRHPSNNDIFNFDLTVEGDDGQQGMEMPFDPFLPTQNSIIQSNEHLQQLQNLPIYEMFSSQRSGSLF